MRVDGIEHIGPYQRLATREVYRNPWIRLRADEVVRPGGIRGEFAVLEMKAGSSVLALDEDRRAYLIEEYKYAIRRHTLEVASGGIDPGETPLDAARRELREEAGLEAAEWTELGTIHPFTTAVDSPVHLYLARNLRHAGCRPEPGEVLRVVTVPLAEALERVMRGDIQHAPTNVLLLKAARLLGV